MRLAVTVLLILLSMAATAHEVLLSPTSGPAAGGIKFGLAFAQSKPDIIYVDRFKSINGGATWAEFDAPTKDAVNNLAVRPQNPDEVYLASSNQLFKSENGALSWKKLGDFGPENSVISALSVNPSESQNVWLGTTHGQVLVSEDSGASWRDASTLLNTSSPISQIVFNSQKADEIWVSTGSWYWSSLVGKKKTGEGLFKSSDGGKAFARLENEFTTDLVQDVAAFGSIAYATAYHAPDTVNDFKALYKSEDGGATWKKLLDSRTYPDGLQQLLHVALNPKRPEHAVVSNSIVAGSASPGFLVTRDGGKTWKPVGRPNMEPLQYTHALEILEDGRVFAQDYYRPFMVSDDGGEHWRWSAKGIRTSTVNALQVDPKNRNAVVAGTLDGALHDTLDGGKSWRRQFIGLESSYVSSIAFDPKDAARFYFGVSGPVTRDGRAFGGPTTDTGVYYLNKSGRIIQRLTGLPDPLSGPENQLEVYDVFVHPQNPNLLLVGTSHDGVFRSEDGGETWQQSNKGIFEEGFYWNVNFEKPEDDQHEINCRTKAVKGLMPNYNCFNYATRTSMLLAANPHEPNEIWYTTLNGVFVSRDMGKSWRWLSDDLKRIHTHYMAFDPNDAQTIYVGSHQGAIAENGSVIASSRGLLISRDSGKTFKQVDKGPGEGFDIRAIGVSPEKPGFIVVGTNGPLFVSSDQGRTWSSVDYDVQRVDQIRIDATANVLYLGTKDDGVWRGVIEFNSSSPAVIAVTGVTAPLKVRVGQSFDVTISLDNLGGKSGVLSLEARLGNKTQTTDVALNAVDQTEYSFSFALDKPGIRELAVNGASYGFVEGTLATPVLTPKPTTMTSTPKAVQPTATISEKPTSNNFFEQFLEAVVALLKSVLG